MVLAIIQNSRLRTTRARATKPARDPNLRRGVQAAPCVPRTQERQYSTSQYSNQYGSIHTFSFQYSSNTVTAVQQYNKVRLFTAER